MSTLIVGVIGPGEEATAADLSKAHELGRLIGGEGWVLLTGGRGVGVMDAASTGAREVGGLTVGVLPSDNKEGLSSAVDIPILTGMGGARYNINVLSSDVLIACGMALGTASEVALALKAEKTVILLDPSEQVESFFAALAPDFLLTARSTLQAVEMARELAEDLI